MAEHAGEGGPAIYQALKDAGITIITYLPDSTCYPIQKLAEADPEMTAICCAREDEGVAVAGGAAFGGGKAALVVDGSGIGWSAYVLAECLQYRLPMLVLTSHSEALGEAREYHNVARLMSESVLRAVRIPYTLLQRVEDAPTIVKQSVRTAIGQKIPVGIVLPPYLMGE
ncbi:MAG TPA: thiamine pyrophosphate-binding protein [Chloroflexota bacterium]